MADPEEFLSWLASKGVGVRDTRDPTLVSEYLGFSGTGSQAEIGRVEAAYGPLPSGVRRWFEVDVPGRLEPNLIFAWQDGPLFAAHLPDELGPTFLVDGWDADYRPMVELGAAPSHLLLLGLTTTIYFAVECVGPRAGWVFSVSSVATRNPREDWARPVARSVEEFLDGIIAVTEAGLWTGDGSYGLMPPEPRVWPPEGMPLAYVAWTSQDYDLPGTPDRQTVVREPPPGVVVLDGSYVGVLGFEPPDRLSEPQGLRVVHDGHRILPKDEEF